MHAPDYMLADRFGTTCGLHRRYTRRASDQPRASKNALAFFSHSPIHANHGTRASLSAFERQSMSFKHSQSPSPDGDDGNPAIHAVRTRPSLGNANCGASAPLAHRHQSVITAPAHPTAHRHQSVITVPAHPSTSPGVPGEGRPGAVVLANSIQPSARELRSNRPGRRRGRG